MFGSSNTFGSSSFGGFGQNSTTNNTQSTGGLFGNKTAFGASNTNTFGSTTSTFGNTSTGGLFGAKPANTNSGGLFGSTNTGSTFGSTSTPFGASNTSAFGSSGGSSIFGNTAASTSSGGLFGGGATSTFGSTNTAFGASNTGSSIFGGGGGTSAFGASTQQNGTNIKYNPFISSDTQVVRGQSQSVQIKLNVITGMKEYEAKSTEELRCEDYLAGRKGGQTGAAPAAASTSLFGGSSTPAASNNTFGGFGSTNTSNTTSGGLFGSTATTGNTTGGGLFGNSTANKPGGLFGSSTNTGSSLFGNTTTNTNTAFGASTTPFGGAASNTSAFGSTGGSSLFGNTANKPTGGLFGASTSTASTGGLFGNTATPAFGSTGTTGTTAFGSSTSTGGLFGNTATSNTSGGLFGNTAAKPAFGSFGNTTSNTTPAFGSTGGTSLFGNSTAAKPAFSSLGGTNTGSSLFGNTSNAFGSTNTGSSLFGNTAAKPGGLFGNTGSTFGATNNTSTSLFGGTNNTLSNNQQPVLGASLDSSHIHQVVAALSSTPFGDSPLFRTALDEHKKLKPATPPPANIGNNKSRISSKLEKVRPRPLNSGYNQLFEGLEDDISPSPEAFLPRNSLKKLVLQSNRYAESDTPDIMDPVVQAKSETHEEVDNRADDVIDTTMASDSAPTRPSLNATPIKLSPIRKLPFNTINDTHAEMIEESQIPTTPPQPPCKTEQASPELDDTQAIPPQEGEEDEDLVNDEPILGLDGKPLKPPPPQLPFTLERPEYYTIPGTAELLDMVQDESLVVRDFVVGRTGYGSVKFLGEVDLWGLDLDSTIYFRRKEISVYPDDNNKPPQGQGLNRRSEVTLECVYPSDKATRNNVTDSKEIISRGFPLYLEKKTAKMGAKFMEYKPESGQWTFMVKHFSKYGFLDDSSDEEEKEVKRMKEEPVKEEENSFDDGLKEDPCFMSDEDNTGYDSPQEEEVSFAPRPVPLEYQGYKSGLFGFNDSEEECDEDQEGDEDVEMFVQGSHFNYSSSISLSKKGALSKTALKMEKLEMSNRMDSPSALKTDIMKEKMIPKQNEETAPNFGVSVVPSVLCLPPLSKSVANGNTHIKMDEGLARHFAYRVGWSGSRQIISKSDTVQEKRSNMKLFASSRGVSSSLLHVSEVNCDTSPSYHTDLLEVQLEHTNFIEYSGSCEAQPESGSACLEALLERLAERQDVTVLGPALQLIKALWADAPDTTDQYTVEQFRKSRLSGWLGEELRTIAQKHTLEHAKLGSCHLPAVISWLCAGGTQEACQLLCKAGDFQLALLVSQSSTPIIRQLLLKQLHEWRDTGYDALISQDRLRIYVLLSGEQIWESSTRTINVCEGIDWLSSFALYLRFLPPSAPLDQAVGMFKEAYECGQVTAPVVDDADNMSVYWQLLMLYCNPAHPLADVLNNQGITANMLDERDVWFIWTTLTALGLPRATPHLASKLVTSYAAQLDRLGLWQWSVFVTQHLPAGRSATVRSTVQRNIIRSNEEEEVACVQRHRVDASVFACGRALYLQYKRDWAGVVRWYTAAGQYNRAHSIFMDKIGPQKIVAREECDMLQLLAPLSDHQNAIQNWGSEGAIYYSYLSLPDTLPKREEDLEAVRHQISSTGHSLNSLPYNTLPEICAVNMMGLRTCTLLIEVWQALFGFSENRELLLTMKTFPLPSDYGIADVITKLSSDMLGEDTFDMVA